MKKSKNKVPKVRKRWRINPLSRIKPSGRIYSRKAKNWLEEWEAWEKEK